MKNTIKWYDESVTYSPNVVISGVPPAAATLVGLIGIGLSPIFTILLVCGVVLSIVNSRLYYTNVHRQLTNIYHRDVWKEYKKLPEAVRNTIPLTVEKVISLSNNQAWELEEQLSRLKKKHEAAEELKAKTSGEVFAIRQALNEAMTSVERDIEVNKEIYDDLKKKELI